MDLDPNELQAAETALARAEHDPAARARLSALGLDAHDLERARRALREARAAGQRAAAREATLQEARAALRDDHDRAQERYEREADRARYTLRDDPAALDRLGLADRPVPTPARLRELGIDPAAP